MVTVSTVLQTGAFLAVLLRFLARRRARNLGVDDWLALLALVFASGLYVTGILICTIGFAGFHASLLEVDQLERFLMLVYIDNLCYALTLPTIKLSILLMYRRLFPTKTFGYATAAVGAIVLGWMISVVLAQILTCLPVDAAWNLSKAADSHCIDQMKFYYGNSISNLLTDVIILCLPLPLIWRLKMTHEKKLGVTAVLLMGGFICIASIVRLSYLGAIDTNDITYTLVAVGNWTSVETPLAIICACLPTIPALFRVKNRFTSGCSGSTSKTDGSGHHPALRFSHHHHPSANLTEYSALVSDGASAAIPLDDLTKDRIRISHSFAVQNARPGE
ncbi:uncharacterized protein BO97DRAFT_402275 [Aspergillus homomorphus CBS 101889]|uniref:Rhodopsin domain-containing protein n=1 Tax=Aspergillus homomorphus (strain CBS 101889) TaxID=1450537 RepID=A0A395IHS3_ASPHC|nr:hypothetical protein BO97DRAFT_402275 [Aspergillus homomorphus CBS 101889]RAL17774.1 hypothetical protein BO97DRAFT_402275 [Aspergillus homomorphus CBS 101889]